MSEQKEHRFRVRSSWNPAGKEGELSTDEETFSTRFAGAPSLGGKAGLVNPEELLLSAIEACFVQTWAIFLAKLKVPIEKPRLSGECRVEKDPAGGYRVTNVELRPEIPSALWNERQADIEKTLALAEKYCIVSKAVRSEGLKLHLVPDVT